MVDDDTLKQAEKTLLEPTSLTIPLLEQVLGNIMTNRVHLAEMYFQRACYESWSLEDSLIKEGSFSLEQGVGIRALAGEKTGFAYSDDLHLTALEEAAKAAKGIALQGESIPLAMPTHRLLRNQSLYSADNPLMSLSEEKKMGLLRQADQLARDYDPRVKRVFVTLSGAHEVILILASDGTFQADIRPLVRFNVRVMVEEQGRIEQGTAGGGGRMGYDYFLSQALGMTLVKDAVRQALVNLEAVPAPAGNMPVVLGPGWPGVLLHEAVGHGLEGDANRKGSSVFAGRIGERVASPLCTVVDDGTLNQRRGSLNVDDEGTVTQCTMLIEKGILKGYMQDKLNARLMNMKSTGNGRRESYAHVPLPRMTNTYMLSGNHDPQEIIASVDKGLYAVNFSGGQVDTTSGKFVFSSNEAYLIEKGKITRPVKGATLIGNGPDILTRVSMVGNDLKLDTGVGNCGKDGQTVPVGVGQPTLKIDLMTVGGTHA